MAGVQRPLAEQRSADVRSARHNAYDWNDPAPLVRLLAGLTGRGGIIAASSEGGLFEYGTDDAVIANLAALGRAGVAIRRRLSDELE